MARTLESAMAIANAPTEGEEDTRRTLISPRWRINHSFTESERIMKCLFTIILGFILFAMPLAPEIRKHHDVIKGRYGGFPIGAADLADDMSAAGISNAIRVYRWDQVEISQDIFDFSLVDYEYYDVMKPNGIEEIMMIRTGQGWATDTSFDSTLGIPIPEESSAPPLNYNEYYDFIFALVDHFKGDVDRFIIENDPLTLYCWYGTASEYKQLVATANQAAKDANPSCTIMANKFPAMSFAYLIAYDLYEGGMYQQAVNFWNGYFSRRDERFQVEDLSELLLYLNSNFGVWLRNFVDETMMPDQAENVDIIVFNYYLHYNYIDEVVAWLNYKMQENGYRKTLLDLEHGVKDERNVVSDSLAAEELVKGYAIVHSLDIPQVGWYPFALDTLTHNYYILQLMYDLTYERFLPPYYAMRTFSDHIGPAHFFCEKQISYYSRYSYKDKLRHSIDRDIVWSDEAETTIVIPFSDAFQSLIVTDYIGSHSDTIPRNGDSVAVEVGRKPKFLKWISE